MAAEKPQPEGDSRALPRFRRLEPACGRGLGRAARTVAAAAQLGRR